MSAEILREAATLMRSRAEAAVYVYASHHPKAGQRVPWFDAADAYSFDETDGPHIMAWSPSVALAVADWLDRTALLAPPDPHHENEHCETCDNVTSALAVATAYLGGDQ